MSTDPIQVFAQQLAVQLASGALTGTWTQVKNWMTRKRHQSASFVRRFEQDPTTHVGELARILRELGFDRDQEGQAILAGLTIHQHGTGGVVVQVGRDAGTIAIHATPVVPPFPHVALTESASEQAYRQHTMWVSATGGDEQAVRVVARFPGSAACFDTEDVSVLSKAAYEYLNVYTAGIPLTGKSSEHAEFETPRTADGRHIVIQALQAGVIDVSIFRKWPLHPGVPWDWLVGEVYTVLLFLNDSRVRGFYNSMEPITVFAKLANLKGGRVSMRGIKHSLRPDSYGRPTNLVIVPLAWREWSLRAGEDPWPAAREFLRLALADSGALDFERYVNGMDGSYFASLYFDLAPVVRFWRPGQAPPQAI